MKTLTTESAWLAIRLDVRQQPSEVVFAITFANTSDKPQQLLFSNLSRKAELAGLRIKDKAGLRVEPDRKFIGRPAEFTEPPRLLQPGEEWTYDLTGIAAAGTLDFPAALYYLMPGQAYQARFAYRGVASSAIDLVL